MVAATLAVIALIVGAMLAHQNHDHEKKTRAQGLSLARSLSTLPLEHLSPGPDRRGVLHAVVNAQRSDGFAYALLVSASGSTLAEVVAPGIEVPASVMPTEPANWFGERSLSTPGDARRVLEFHSPVMDRSQLVGFVRLGYLADPPRLGLEQLSWSAALALPIFLLTPLFYFLVRREMKPLATLSLELQRMGRAADSAPPPLPDGLQLQEFVERFGRFLNATEARVRELESERQSSVTSNRLLSYKKSKVEAILQSLPDGVMVLDESCVPTFANARTEALVGIAPERVVGRTPRDWCTQPALLAFLLRHQWRGGDAAPHAARAEVSLEGTPPQHLSLSSYPLFAPTDHANVFGTLIVIRDTTQEQLARNAGADFVSHVSHELKTPLNTIASYSELLMETPDDAHRIEAVNVIHDEVGRMSGLINNLLNISKLESGAMKLERQRVNLRDLLVDCFEAQRQSALGKGLAFRIDVPPNLGAASLDKDLFRIALNNLLSNAIKYNRPGGHVELSAEESDDRTLSIHVRDGGIGIAPEWRERIFDKHFRVGDAATASRQGHGLGLYLAQQIVEAHQGSISVDSQPGRGTDFSIRVRKLAAVYEEALAA